MEDENDLELIRGASLQEGERITFLNFHREERRTSEGPCECDQKGYGIPVFTIDRNGIARFRALPPRKARAEFRGRSHLKYIRMFPEIDTLCGFYPGKFGAPTYYELIKEAKEAGVEFQNCHFCRYSTENRNPWKPETLFCKSIWDTCKPKDAVTCDKYWERLD